MYCWKKFTVIICIIIIGCKKEDNFPDVYVNESIYLAGSAEYIDFYGNLYAWDTIPGGIGGIIIVQGHNETFMAYDRACTYETNGNEMNENCIIYDTPNQYIFSCQQCCKSKFSIIDGSISEGPAGQALKAYNTYFDGTYLYITN